VFRGATLFTPVVRIGSHRNEEYMGSRKIVIFIILSVGILYASNYFVGKNKVSAPAGQAVVVQNIHKAEIETQSEFPKRSSDSSGAKEQRTVIENSVLAIEISNIGSIIQNINLKQFSKANSSEKINLVSADGKSQIFDLFAKIDNKSIETAGIEWKKEKQSKNNVVYSAEINGIVVEKEIAIYDQSYYGQADIRLKNMADNPQQISDIYLNCGPFYKNDENRMSYLKAEIFSHGKINKIGPSKNQSSISKTLENG
jgi:YidC/Oxa1 family membrane protein insertase